VFNRKSILAGLSALLMLAPISATAQVGRFDGGGTIYGFNRACQNGGWSGGPQAYRVRLHPDSLGTNGNTMSVAFFGDNHAFSFSLTDPANQYDWQSFDAYYLFSRPSFTPSDAAFPAQIRVRSVRPTAIDETTSVPVRFRGQIRNFSGIQYCRVEFDVVVTQRLP